jgi:hypothetical protein
MRLSANRYEGERRPYVLALSMIEHGARNCTIKQWTGLSRCQIENLCLSYPSATRTPRKRGESPYQPAYFFKSLQLARESAALAYIASQMQALPDEVVPDAGGSLPSVTRGECLVGAFEVYRTMLPGPLISLEYAILLITELAQADTLILARCRSCPEVIVLDRLAPRHGLCPLCRSRHRAKRRSRDLLRQQQFHQGVEHDNHHGAERGHDQNQAGREMGSVHEDAEK